MNGLAQGCYQAVGEVQTRRRRVRVVDVEQIAGGHVVQDYDTIVYHTIHCNITVRYILYYRYRLLCLMLVGVWNLEYLRPSPIVNLKSRLTEVQLYNVRVKDPHLNHQ